jgi:PKD repeat protein
MPTPTPAPQTLDIPYGNRTLEVGAFTNASITASSFDASQKAVNVNVTVPEGTSGFADFILQQNFLSRPYNVTLDGSSVSAIEADTNMSSYLYLALTEGFHTVSIIGAEFHNVPEAIVSYPATVGIGQNVTFDASKSIDVGYIVSYEWSFGDGTNGTGRVVLHAYSKKGIYHVELNETDNYGLSSSETFTISVGIGSGYFLLAMQALVAAVLVLVVLMFVVLVRRRRKERVPEQ